MPAWSWAPKLLSRTAVLSAGAETCHQLPNTTVLQAYYGSAQQQTTQEMREWTDQVITFMAGQPLSRMDNTKLSIITHHLIQDKAHCKLLLGPIEAVVRSDHPLYSIASELQRQAFMLPTCSVLYLQLMPSPPENFNTVSFWTDMATPSVQEVALRVKKQAQHQTHT